jgi:hypothetical protein
MSALSGFTQRSHVAHHVVSLRLSLFIYLRILTVRPQFGPVR